jgi:hypothetical protein
MPLYTLITEKEITDQAALDRLQNLYEDNKKVAANAWVINAKVGTTKDISEAIFPRQSGTGDQDLPAVKHVLFKIESWWGFHDRTFWEWLDSSRKADAQ